MVAAISLNNSTVFAGLGTSTTTITTAGIYTLGVKSFLPYLAAGSPAITTAPSAEITDVTQVADSAGSLNSTYWTFNTAGDALGYYVWYNINSAGVDPAVSGRTGIAVAGATNASANTLATAARTAIAASTAGSYVAVSGATSHIILTNKQMGACTDAANGTASPGLSYSITQGSFGAPAQSGLVIQLKQNSTVLATYAFPSASQPIMGGSVVINAAASDTVSVVLSSLSTADAGLNAVKSIFTLYPGIGGY